VAAATGRSRVGDGGEVGQQVRMLGVLDEVGVGEVGQRRLGSGTMGRQAWASVQVMGLW
jgi:hypothetical protein